MNSQGNRAAEFAKPAFRRQLLEWYDAHARDLPWRKNHDPYRVWVSEIMLQQTRVAAVIAHYHEFLRRFPTVKKLAAAREASVLAAWSGLGYYRRARMLHAAARLVARKRGGKFPETAQGWEELPGIGRYTAAAIASIAFGGLAAVVDGNVERVLQRVLGERLSQLEIWRRAEELLDQERPGDFNQAMMELGATVCTPRAPSCLTCPVIELCTTRGEMAVATKAPRQTKREIHYALDCRAGEVLLVQRPRDASLMAGMWELPELSAPVLGSGKQKVPHFVRNDKEKKRTNKVRNNDKALGSRKRRRKGKFPALLFSVKHSITVTDYTVRVWDASSNSIRGEWVAVGRLKRVALTGLARKILRKTKILQE
ncbi:MAG: A/G-specific adenine glycosylase [Candidatus Sulfotelmatobacter sp.]|jgi:A/G-specific adenine glycosylase